MIKKKKYRFNFIDFLIIAAIVALGAIAIYLIAGNRLKVSDASSKISYTVTVDIIQNKFADNVKVGDKVVDTVKAYTIGTVTKVETTDAYVAAVNNDTEEMNEKIVYPDHKRLKITVEADASTSGAKYSIGGYDIAIGQRINFRVPDLVATGFCTSITVLD